MRIKRFTTALTAGIMLIFTMTNTAFAYNSESESDAIVIEETSEKAENEKIGTVNVRSGSHLHLRSGAGMDHEITGKLVEGEELRVIGKDGFWYKVVVPERTGYVHGDYLSVAEQDASATVLTESSDDEASSMLQSGQEQETNQGGLTPPGNLTLVDDIGPSSGAGQQFITLVSKNGNTFYLVIDRDDDGNENVHFMNLVDEADLFALLGEDEQLSYNEESQLPIIPETDEETEQSTIPEVPETEAVPEKGSNWAPLMLLTIFGIGGVGFAGYRFINKKKQAEAAVKPDPDVDYQDESDEEYDLPEENDYEEDEIDLVDAEDYYRENVDSNTEE